MLNYQFTLRGGKKTFVGTLKELAEAGYNFLQDVILAEAL